MTQYILPIPDFTKKEAKFREYLLMYLQARMIIPRLLHI